jgi:hypothetical protein
MGLVVIGILLVALIINIFVTWRLHAAFAEKFPPISDEEFLARCSPGTSREVALKVRRIMADIFGVEYERIHPSARIMDDLAGD